MNFLSLNMKEAAAEVMRENEEFAAKLGINKAQHIKPEGTLFSIGYLLWCPRVVRSVLLEKSICG